jgi:hypothetical protein
MALPDRRYVVAFYVAVAAGCFSLTVHFLKHDWLPLPFLILAIYSTTRLVRMMLEGRNA